MFLAVCAAQRSSSIVRASQATDADGPSAVCVQLCYCATEASAFPTKTLGEPASHSRSLNFRDMPCLLCEAQRFQEGAWALAPTRIRWLAWQGSTRLEERAPGSNNGHGSDPQSFGSHSIGSTQREASALGHTDANYAPASSNTQLDQRSGSAAAAEVRAHAKRTTSWCSSRAIFQT